MKKLNWRKAQTDNGKETPFRIKNETERVRSAAIMDIERRTKSIWEGMNGMLYKAGVARTENGASRLIRGPVAEQVTANPVFTHDQEAGLKKYVANMLVIIFFVASEAGLYYMISACYIPHSTPALRVVLALFLSFLGMKGVSQGYSARFIYLEALHTKTLTAFELAERRDKYYWGTIVMALSFVGIVAAGLARCFFLESIPEGGMSPQRLHAVIMAGKATSVFTMVVGLTCAMILATQKHDQAALGQTYFKFRKWRKVTSKHDRCNKKLGSLAIAMLSIIEQRIEKAWQEMIAVKKNLASTDECDTKHAALNREYDALKAASGFIVTDAIYLKFSAIQGSCEALFKYGLLNVRGIKEKIALAHEALARVDNHVVEHTPEFMKTNLASNPSGIIAWHKPNNGAFVKNGVTAVVLSCFFFLASCTPERKPVSLVVLPDLSGSRDTTVVTWYKNAISQQVIPAMGQKDRIAVHPIDYGSQTFDEAIYAKDFSSNVYENEYDGQQTAEIAEQRHHDSILVAATAFEKAFNAALIRRKAYRKGTDIIGALAHVRSIGGDSAIAVIFSDMLQETDATHVNLASRDFAPKDYPALISKMEHVNLRGIRIVVITGEQAAVSPARFESVRGLWTLYFQACGGNLLSYTSGSLAALKQDITNSNNILKH